jgi:DNA-binding NarL/FixJ family response regulator
VCLGTVCLRFLNTQNTSVTVTGAATSVLVAVESARVREALAAMFGAVEGFRVVAEAGCDQAALEAARAHRPHLALVEVELSGCGGYWAIRQMQAEGLVSVVVALGRRAHFEQAELALAPTYIQMGTSPRDLLNTVERALALGPKRGSAGQTEHDLLADAHPMLDKPALVDL